MKPIDRFLETAESKPFSFDHLCKNDIRTELSFRERYTLLKNRLGVQLFESELGFEQMVYIIYETNNMNIQKTKLYQNGLLTPRGKDFITAVLNKIYKVGLENIQSISIQNLEFLEQFFDELELEPYLKERQYQKKIGV